MVGLSRWLVIGRLDRGYERDIRFMVAKCNKKRDSLKLVSLALVGSDGFEPPKA